MMDAEGGFWKRLWCLNVAAGVDFGTEIDRGCSGGWGSSRGSKRGN